MFAKIFAQIFDSSIADRPEVRRMFMDMLVLADPSGIVDMTHEAIARRINVPLDEVRTCISALELPDDRSRSKEMEGKRLIRIDHDRNWGWRIVNWEKYRQSATKEMLRMAEADRKAEYRRRYGNHPKIPSPSTPPTTKGRTEAEADPSRTCPGQVPDSKSSLYEPDFEIFWNAYPRKVGKHNAARAWKSRNGVPLETILKAVEAQKKTSQWQKDGGQFIPHPATWLNQHRWEDAVPKPVTPKLF